MIYTINKIIGFMSGPIGVSLILLFFALLCARLKFVRVAKIICVLSIAWLWIWMTPMMGRIVGVPLEREFIIEGRVPRVESFPEADAIVVLGGGMGAGTNLTSYAEMYSGADRVWQAVRLWKAKKASKIIATSAGVKLTTFPLMKDFGVPENCIVKVDAARNTEEEAKCISMMGVKRILLVTSAWHMKRARLMFEMYAPGTEVICAPADFENSLLAERPFSVYTLLPDSYAFLLNSVALHEWVGIVGYKLFR